MADPITTIGLCAGVGWLDEGVRAGLEYLGLRHRTVGYVERDSYAAAVLLARMEESSLEPTPVWCGDLADFDGRAFRGTVDGIVAGFPCQPWSNAGQRKGTADDRWLWPAIVRVIADVGPWFVFLENVSALIAGGGLEHVLSDLAEMGFDAEWCCLTAEAVGASHRRERVFILAYRPEWPERFRQWIEAASGTGGESGTEGCGEGTDDTTGARRSEAVSGTNQRRTEKRSRQRMPRNGRGAVAVTGSVRGRISQQGRRSRRGTAAGGTGDILAVAASKGLQGERKHNGATGRQDAAGSTGLCSGELFAPGPGADWSGIPEFLWPATERGVRVLVDGSPVVLDESRADQLRCSGNGVVALQGATAFVELVRLAGMIRCA